MAKDMGKVSDGYHTFDELYEHRHRLFLLLVATYTSSAWASRKHSDGSSLDGWFICGMVLQEGQISYHLPDRLWPEVERLGIVVDKAPEFDGHTSDDVVERLTGFFSRVADKRVELRRQLTATKRRWGGAE